MSDQPPSGPCLHEWVTHLIQMPGYTKPGATTCQQCGAVKPVEPPSSPTPEQCLCPNGHGQMDRDDGRLAPDGQPGKSWKCAICGIEKMWPDLDARGSVILIAAPAAEPSWPEPAVRVEGRLERTLDAFERACLTEIEHMQTLISPDNALIALLCDAVRMKREYVECATSLEKDAAP